MTPHRDSGGAMLSVLRALRFHDADDDGLRALAMRDPEALLAATDRAQLTLPLALRCAPLFPASARTRLEDSLSGNALCHERVVSAYREIATALETAAVPFVVLKGLTQWPWYVDDARHRPQSDIDLFCPPASLEAARAVLEALGYHFAHDTPRSPTDHLPVMIRRTGWTWQGNYFDPERPPSVELHFRFWDAATEGFSAGDVEALWNRREHRDLGGLSVPALNPCDGLAYSAMHLVRHLLRGDLQLRHAYELAHFLERSAAEDAFWLQWEQTALGPRRLVQAIAFRLATDWFHCRPHPAVTRACAELPAPVRRWFALFSNSPATVSARPNKDELWLHLCLIPDGARRRQIMLRRLFPTRRQRVIADPHTLPGKVGLALRLRRTAFEVTFIATRAVHHLRTFWPLVRSGMRWWKARTALS